MASVNLQNQPKTREYLECFVAADGYKLVSMDFAALEPKVLAYFSRDPNLLKLYGEKSKKNDVYLFNAANASMFKDKVRATGYDPDNPTPEAIRVAKKTLYKTRAISKRTTLSFQYHASADKIHNELLVDGIKCSIEEVRQFHKELSDSYRGIDNFKQALMRKWYNNHGWIQNGIGRPMPIDDEKKKDIINRVVQSTGHDILVKFIHDNAKNLDAAGIEWYPWIIDYHDESIIETREEHAEIAADCFRKTLSDLNEQMDWDVKMSGDVIIADNLADIKVEDD
jgi:DNA polymerase I-like protein with 3'-5' exonuclease and polymerase domains